VSVLATCRASELAESPPERRWLVEGLWGANACGIVGGEPKCGKSFLALDLAVAVAAGVPALGRFPVVQPGPVLVYPAEDAPAAVRRRLEGIARIAGVRFATLDVHVITEPTVRLDLARDRERLARTVEAIRPRLVVLDPLVRLHRVDENTAGEIAPVLAGLRELERGYATAVMLVHHARKGAGHARAGQALRGSSELHAWGDSNLYVRRAGERIVLTVEHRNAPSIDGIDLALAAHDGDVALEIIEPEPPGDGAQASAPSAAQRVRDVLADAGAPLTVRALRQRCRIKTATLCAVLAELEADGALVRAATGYTLAPARAFPVSLEP